MENINLIDIAEIYTAAENENSTEKKKYKSLFYDASRKLIFDKSLYGRRHNIIYTNNDGGSTETIYTIANHDAKTVGAIFLLIENLDANNMIMLINEKTNRLYPAASKQDLYNIMGYGNNRRIASKIYNLLYDKGVILEVKTQGKAKGDKIIISRRFYINPVYTMRYQGIPLDTYKIFKEIIDTYLPDRHIREIEKRIELEETGEFKTIQPPVLKS